VIGVCLQESANGKKFNLKESTMVNAIKRKPITEEEKQVKLSLSLSERTIDAC
jgi:hypothetical protein